MGGPFRPPRTHFGGGAFPYPASRQEATGPAPGGRCPRCAEVPPSGDGTMGRRGSGGDRGRGGRDRAAGSGGDEERAGARIPGAGEAALAAAGGGVRPGLDRPLRDDGLVCVADLAGAALPGEAAGAGAVERAAGAQRGLVTALLRPAAAGARPGGHRPAPAHAGCLHRRHRQGRPEGGAAARALPGVDDVRRGAQRVDRPP